jgi:LysR family glycine cleavage system transcriptional activator
LNKSKPFRSYDTLKVLDAVARHSSLTGAAGELNRSKGSVSYQVGKLEADLGFQVFTRERQRLALSEKGRRLWHASQAALAELDRTIAELRGGASSAIAVGMQSYFAARWLSPRLVRFIESHPGVGLRIEPLNDRSQLPTSDVDIAIFWGNGEWTDLDAELLFRCPAAPTASPALAGKVAEMGLERAVATLPLLVDSSGDQGWRDWHRQAGLEYRPAPGSVVLPDSASRVQAVIDGQGIALWDALVEPEVQAGKLVYVSDIRLDDAGYYLVYPRGAPGRTVVSDFREWIRSEARGVVSPE